MKMPPVPEHASSLIDYGFTCHLCSVQMSRLKAPVRLARNLRGRSFYGKKRNIWKGNLYLTENRETKCFAQYNRNHMCHMCAKGFLDSNLNLAIIDKILFFLKLNWPKFYIKNRNFKSRPTYHWKETDQFLLLFTFNGRNI